MAIADRPALTQHERQYRDPATGDSDRGAENDLVWTALRHGMGLTPFFPLAQGVLSGKYAAGQAAHIGSEIAFSKRRRQRPPGAVEPVHAMRRKLAQMKPPK